MAVLAVALTGLSKGGLGGAFGLMGVPVLSLAMSPVQAAALMLPVLLAMDAVSLWTWRRGADRTLLRAMLPPALAGIGLGWLAAAVTSEAMVRLIVGVLAFAFVARQLAGAGAPATGPRRAGAVGWGLASGFTSFVAHAGGPPFQMHVLPLRLPPGTYTATSVLFFATLNAVKVIPYAALGLIEAPTLLAAAWLLPVAVVAVLSGAWVVRRLRAQLFYPLMYSLLGIVALKLVWDGVTGLI
jgi:uncharacterized membrane protein YfcA